MARITICDICKKHMGILDDMIKINGKNYRLRLKVIENSKWKSKDVCFDCIRKNLPSKKKGNK